MNKEKVKILLVEDDINMGFLIVEYLEDNNFEVKLCKDGISGIKAWKNGKFDFCIFDIMLPKMDGFSIAKQVRSENKKVPIILLTAKSMKEDKLKGYNLGIDEYITKPFDEEVLLCKIKAILMRSETSECETNDFFQIGKYSFNYKNQNLKYEKESKRLTKKESDIFQLLCISKNNIIKREDILLNIWGNDDYFTGRSLDVFITKLRKYLKEDLSVKIESIPGVGYILSDRK